ncbi:MAG TPA: TetR/AcrR family transcriptional regulator [Solirubrobacterales bacterium]|nr:TetR/AcrR family transcriptional regulator [Solirubrobacterales bacterium]
MSLANDTPTPPATRTERRKARTAGAILEAAERLFLSRGYTVTTMEELSETADVAVGSIYAHFGGKEGVYSALVDRALALDKRYGEEGLAAGGSPLERLIGIGEGYLRFAREHPAYFRLFRFPPPDRPSAQEAPGPAARIAERISAEVTRMAGLLSEAAEEGAIRPVDPKPMARFMWAAWDGVIAAHLGPANMDISDAEFEQMLNQARVSLIRGLLPTS